MVVDHGCMGRRAADRVEVEVAAHDVVRGISRPFCSCGWRADVGVDPDVAVDAHLANAPPASSPVGTVVPGLVAAGADRFGVADVDVPLIDGARVGDHFGEHSGLVVLTVPVLRGDGVLLRAWRVDGRGDVAAVVETFNDPATRRQFPGLPHPFTENHAAEFIETREEMARAGAGITWAIADQATGQAVGLVSVTRLDERAGHGEVGYWVRPSARRAGYATRAVQAAADHAFTPAGAGGLGLSALTVICAVTNTASRSTAQRAGFTLVDLQPGDLPVEGGGTEAAAAYQRHHGGGAASTG